MKIFSCVSPGNFNYMSGRITGIRANGGFEVLDLQWKEGKIEKVEIKSTIGGNLRVSVSNALGLESGDGLNEASRKTPILSIKCQSPQIRSSPQRPRLTFLIWARPKYMTPLPSPAHAIYL
jgi:hypothetical protein